jgi:hypothetical protein
MKKKLVTFTILLAFAVSTIVPASVLADCGKMVIYVFKVKPRKPPRKPFIYCPPEIPREELGNLYGNNPYQVPNYGQNGQQKQEQQQSLNNSNKNLLNLDINVGSVPPPPVAQGGAIAYGNTTDATFSENNQQAVIAWNGKSDDSGEETLILTTNEISRTKEKMAMLSVLPLPGKPISIDRANARVFVETKILLDKKLAEVTQKAGQVGGFGVFMTQTIGSNNIFVCELDNINTFKEEVIAYVADKYNNEATALITDKTVKTIQQYFDQGFRYFAFDLTEVGTEQTTKEAIAYRFKSKFAYYPLAISAIGGTGHSLIDFIVITPGAINLAGAFEQGKEQAKPMVKANMSVNFTLNELKQLDPKLADAFKDSGLSSVKVRNFLIEADDIGKTFTKDFQAINAQ